MCVNALILFISVGYWEISINPPPGSWLSAPSLEAVAPEWLKGAIIATWGAIATVSAIIMIIGTIPVYLPGKEKVWGHSRNRFFSRSLHRLGVVVFFFL